MGPKPVFLITLANDVAASLRLDEEWRQMDKALQAHEDAGKLRYTVIPYATRDDVWDKFNRFHNQITIFHYGGHSGSKGLNLKDSVLEGKNLATLLEQEQNLKLVFLNGCSNAGQVKELLDKGVPAVIATSAPINDRRAVHLARQFYTALCSGRSIKEAFDIAAAYVNNEEKEILVAYRNLGFQEEPKQFPWGLYAKDEAVLGWKIPKVGTTGQSGGLPRIPAWLRLMLGISLGAVLLFLGYKLWLETGNTPPEVVLDCSAGHKTAVFVAPFQQTQEDNFSGNMITKLRAELELGKELYRVGEADFNALNIQDYYDTIRVEYFEHTCDTSGLFLGGRWDRKDSLLNCYINLYNLVAKIPELSGTDRIILRNPPGLAFKVVEDSEFLADFVVALLRVYEGEPYQALEKFYKLEKEDTVKLQDPVLKAYVAHYKGNCYAMRGDQERAERSYQEAVKLHSGLREVSMGNSEFTGQIEEIMRAHPKLDSIRKKNIAEHSALETYSPSESTVGSLSGESRREPEIIEIIAGELQDSTGDAAQPPEEGQDREEQAWAGAKSSNTISSYARYLKDYPNGKYALEAKKGKRELEEERAWADAQRQNTAAAYEDYREKYPNGAHYAEAGEKIQGLKPPETTPAKSKYVTNKRSGYKEIPLNGKTWLAENLNLKVDDSWCYDEEDANCQKYGRLYTWQAAQEACKKLGSGWRLPTDEEWRNMAKLLGGADNDAFDRVEAAYKALIDKGGSGFNALLGGWRDTDGSFHDLGDYGRYWSATESSGSSAWYHYFDRYHGQLSRYGDSEALGFACRCVQD